MKQDSSDQPLIQLFERQRAADRRSVPSFAPDAAAVAAGRRSVKRGHVALRLAAVAVIILAAAMFRARTAHAPATVPDPIASAEAILDWQSPTDFLLVDYTAPSSPITLPSDALLARGVPRL